jgi:hypothetical protein
MPILAKLRRDDHMADQQERDNASREQDHDREQMLRVTKEVLHGLEPCNSPAQQL